MRKHITQNTLKNIFLENKQGNVFDKKLSITSNDNTTVYDLADLNFKSKRIMNTDTEIVFENNNTVDAIHNYSTNGNKMVVLNFASARNAGGSYSKQGRMAQEESLCYASNLYHASLQRCVSFYKENKEADIFYSNKAIYSPNVQFVRNSNMILVVPSIADVISCPAVNAGARKGIDKRQVSRIMVLRVKGILNLAYRHGNDTVILGAWGCGVFGNDIDVIASIFKDALHGDFKDKFKKVIFAIPDDNTLTAFKTIITGC